MRIAGFSRRLSFRQPDMRGRPPMDRDIWFNLSLIWLAAVLCGAAYLLFQVWG
jgi:hypothetical protein